MDEQMAQNEELRKFIETERANGTPDEQIRRVLKEQGGWTDELLSPYFAADTAPAGAAVPQAPQPQPFGQTQTQTVQPQVQPTYGQNDAQMGDQAADTQSGWGDVVAKKKLPILTYVAVVVLVLFFVAGAVYGFMKFGGLLFAQAPYSGSNLITGILDKSAGIKTVAYTASGDLEVVPREPGAKPFSLIASPVSAEKKAEYERDYQRLSDMYTLRTDFYSSLLTASDKKDLASINAKEKSNGFSYYTFNTTDPKTHEPYTYSYDKATDNFKLTMTFETQDAIQAIRNTASAGTTTISGMTVTFTKNGGYIYFPQEPPKPLLEQWSDASVYIPKDLSFKGTVSAQTAVASTGTPDFSFSVDVDGNLGDLSYKIAGDLLKVGKDYYFRIRDFPTLFFGAALSGIKGEWVDISPSKLSSSTPVENYYANLVNHIPKATKSYKEERAVAVSFLQAVAKDADKDHVFTITNKPAKEQRNKRSLYRYDLSLNGDAVAPFMQDAINEANKTKNLEGLNFLRDQALLDWLKSDEAKQVIQYLKNNTSLVLWVDDNGYLRDAELKIKIIPPDKATQLKDKEVVFTIDTALNSINQDVNIKKPTNAKSFKDVFQAMFGPQIQAQNAAKDSAIKSNMLSLKIGAEMYHDKQTPPSYGPRSTSCTSGMFSDAGVASSLSEITADASSTPICHADGQMWAVSVPLNAPKTDGASWCSDSTGKDEEISNPLSSGQFSCP